MPHRVITGHQRPTRPLVSIALFVLLVGFIAFVRLHVFGDRMISLTSGLLLVLCLWYPSRRLLWSLAGAFAATSTYKAFVLLPARGITDPHRLTQLAMEVGNLLVIAATVHLVLNLIEVLKAKNGELERTNDELSSREEEISRQNEELQRHNEELATQSEEIQQQSEELQRQTAELEAQTAELEVANAELATRQAMLERLLHALQVNEDDGAGPARVCESALSLFATNAVAAAILLRDGDEIRIDGTAGQIAPEPNRWDVGRSLASVVLEHAKPAAISDLALRPDVIIPSGEGRAFRAILAAPLWLDGKPAGALEFYSAQPHDWTREHFQIAEWAAAQCSLILEARRLQLELRSANAALEKQVEARTRELQELVNELEHFSYTITHDLRAPLRAMQGYAGVLEEECRSALTEEGRSYLHRIATAATRMDQLITDALSYSRTVRQELPMTAVDPAKLLRGMIESYPMFQPPHAHVEIAGDLPPIIANEAGLTQCFSNLLGNAVKFVAPGTVPRVIIRSERNGPVVRIWVEDNGIGIAPALQPRLFNMFQRLSKEYEGTGIGLALVRKVAERMGGRVGVISESRKGSRFWLELQAGS